MRSSFIFSVNSMLLIFVLTLFGKDSEFNPYSHLILNKKLVMTE